MALKNRKEDHLFMSYQEAKTGNENAPQTYKETAGRFESRGIATLWEPTRMYESDKGKLGTGQHGLDGKLQAIGTPFSISSVERLSEFCFFLSFMLGKAVNVNIIDAGNVWSHMMDHLGEASLELPTFTMEYGKAAASGNDCLAGCIINDCSITFPFNSGNGKIDATFNGWGNSHYSTAGALTKLSAGSITSASEDISSEALINAKSTQVWIAEALEDNFGHTSIDFTDEDLGSTLVEITDYINSLTITFNNGMSLEGQLRGGGGGIVNNWTRNLPAITLELNIRKDAATMDWHGFALADTPKALEILFQGNVITGAYRNALDIFFPVVEIRGTPEDDETPVSQTLSAEVYENSSGYALRAFAQSGIDEGYNAVAP